MKKIYFLFVLMMLNGLAMAQVSLPYAYNFDASNTLTEGWQSEFETPTSLTLQMVGVRSSEQGAPVFSAPNSWIFSTIMQWSGGYNQYLISPRFVNTTTDSVQVRFKYCVADGTGQAELFRVGYTTADSYSSTEDFTWRTGIVEAHSEEWQTFSVNLPAEAQYMIIHYCPGRAADGVSIDNILIRPDSPNEEHTVYVSANAGGTVSPSASVADGDDYTLTVTANPGHYILSVLLDGEELPQAAFQNSFTYLLSGILTDHTFTVTFMEMQYSIFVIVGAHGSVTPDGGVMSQVMVPWGHDTTFYFTGDAGYHVEDVVVDNVWHGGSISSYTFSNVTANHTISVSFTVNDYVITASAGEGGSISPSGEVGVTGLTNQSFTITPDLGYLIDTVFIDDEPVSGFTPSGWTYTFYEVSASHTISAVFARQQYEVTFSHSAGGTLVVVGGDSINENTRRVYYSDVLDFSFLPDEGYQFADLLVDGVSVGAQNPYQLTHVLQNSTVYAVFAEQTFSVTVVKHGYGTVTPMSAVDSGYFSTATFTFSPYSCRQLDSLVLDEERIATENPCMLTHLVGNHQLDVYFGDVYYTMTAEPAEHGTLTAPRPVACSGNAVFALKADPCYVVGHFFLDGVQHDEYLMPVTADSSVAIVTNCREEHTASAIFTQKTYGLTVTASGTGTISYLGSQQVPCGTQLSFTVVPDECSYVSMLKIDDVDVTETVEHHSCSQAGFGDTLLFTLDSIAASHTVQVAFSTMLYHITPQVVGNGTVSPSGVRTVQCSGNQLFEISPAACNRIRGVWADEMEVTDQLVYVDEVATYTFSDVRDDHSLRAEFEGISYQMSFHEGEHGRLIPSGDSMVACAGDLQLLVLPDACYYADTVWIDGVVSTDLMQHRPNAHAQTGDTLLYTFANISENHNIESHFAQITYPITTMVVGNGQITGTVVSGEAYCGDALTFTITPDDCYDISLIEYNGEELTDYQLDGNGVATFDIASLGAPVELTAWFELRTYPVVETTPEHGTLGYPSGEIGCGQSLSVFFMPDACYHLDSAYVDGVWYLPSQLMEAHGLYYYRVAALYDQIQVSAHFSVDSVHFVSSGLVPVSVADTMLACGQPFSCYSIIPDCQQFDSIYVNGVAMTESDFHHIGSIVWSDDTLFLTFDALTADCHLSVSCSTVQYRVMAGVNGNGSVDWPSSRRVDCGDSIAIAIYPDDCYSLQRVLNYGTLLEMDNDTLLIIRDVHSDYRLEFFFEGMEFEASLTSSEWGRISGVSSHLACGERYKYEFEAEECAHLDSVWLNGQCVNSLLDTMDHHIILQMNNVRESFSIDAQFVKDWYTVRRQVTENGIVVEDESQEVLCGSDTLLSARWPDDCYKVTEVKCNGVDTVVLEEYAFHIQNSIFLEMEIKRNHYQIEVQPVSHCEISSVSLTDDYECGENASYRFTPEEGFYIQNIVVDGDLLPAADYYDFSDIHDNHTLSVVVANYVYALQCEVLSGEGSAVPADAHLPYGTDTVVRLYPAQCQHIDSVWVNGAYVGSDDEYHFVMTADVLMQVKFATDTNYVYVSCGENGHVSCAAANAVLCGSDFSITITPEEGYYVAGIVIDGVPQAPANSYTFVNVTQNHTMEVTFAIYQYEITVTAGAGGAVQPSSNVWVAWGEQQHFDIVPDQCYHIDSVFVDGVYYGNIGEYTFNHVTAPHEIAAVFARNGEAIAASAGEGGTIVPSGAVQLLCGDSQSFDIQPNECYSISDILVDGVSVGANNTYAFENVEANHTIEAVFESLVKQVTLGVVGDGGSLSQAGDTSVTCGDDLAVTITPAPCHIIQSVQINGTEWTGFNPAGDVYTFSNIRGDSSLTATFAMAQDTITVTANNAHGTVTSLGENVLDCGSDFSITITPDDCYRVGTVRVDGVIQNSSSMQTVGDSKILTLNNVVENHIVSVNFNQLDYLLTARTDGGGIINPMGAFPVCGSSMTFTVEPVDCYAVDSVFVNGVYLPSSNLVFDGDIATFEVTDIREDINIYVKFRGLHYQLNLVNNGDGEVMLSQGGVDCDGDLTFSILPSACERIAQVLLNSEDITADLSFHPNVVSWLPDTAVYVITNVQANQDLVINYQPADDKQLVVNYYDGAQLMSQDVVGVGCGSDTTLHLAYTCYAVDRIVVNGEEVTCTSVGDSAADYSLYNVLVDYEVNAFFSQMQYTITATADEGGSITPVGVTDVLCGGSQSYTITPDEGYYILSLMVDGVQQTVQDSWTFSDVRSHHTISAAFARYSYTVTASAGEGGSVSPSGISTVLHGDDLTVTVIPDNCYHIDSVLVDGVYSGNITSYTFSGITANHMLTATFERDSYTITANASEGGSITPVGVTEVMCGSSQSYIITPEEGYYIASLTVDGAPATVQGSWTFGDVHDDHTIAVEFAHYRYTVTTVAGEGGSVTPAGATTVEYGENLTVAIEPEDCYHIDSVFVDGVYSGAIASHAFSAITADHTLSATFMRDSYTIIATAGEGGSITPAGTVEVLCDGSQNYTIVPEEGYYIATLTVDGEQVTVQDSWVFSNVRANHTIMATFAHYGFTVTATAGEGGSVSPAGTTNVEYGESLTVSIVPDDCFALTSIVIDGEEIEGLADSYTFNNVVENHTMDVAFEPIEYNLSSVVYLDGEEVLSDMITAFCGEMAEVEIPLFECFHMDSLRVNGERIEPVEIYIIEDVRMDYMVEAFISDDIFYIESFVQDNGTISPSDTMVFCTNDVTVTIIPDDCYHVDSVFVDGVYSGAISSYLFSDINDNHTISATFARDSYTLTATAGEGGSISPAGTSEVLCGDSQSYTITPEEGYYIATLTVDGEQQAAQSSWTFSDVRGDHTIAVTFAHYSYTVTMTAGEGGSATPAGTTNVEYGENLTVTIAPDDCYHIDSVFVDGAYAGAITSYTFSNITADHTLSATFARDSYTITATAGEGGSITPAGTSEVLCGDSQSYSITPEEGYYIATLTVDGEQQAAQNSWTFSDVRGDHTIAATFGHYSYSVTTTSGEGGSVTPAGTTNVEYGENLTVTIAPDDCYHIDSVFVDGAYAGAITSYTFSNITADHTLSATFARDSYIITATAGEGGNISPVGTTEALCGDSQSYTITPDEGYYIATLTVDGEQQAAQSSWTFSDVRGDHTIAVTFGHYSYSVTTIAGEGGSVNPAGTTNVEYGENLTVTIAPDDCYHIDSVFVDGAYAGAITSYTFSNITADHSLSATFARDSYTITATAGEGGSIIPAGMTEVLCGDNQSYTITPDEGYYIATLTVDGEQQAAQNSWTFSDVRGDHTIAVTFAHYSYTVTTTAGEGGSVTPAGTTNVEYGENLTVTITPDDCYHIDSVFVDGAYAGAITSYTFSNITADHTLSATFARDSYIITATAGEGGSITPAGTTEVLCGDSQSYTITPDDCYVIDSVFVDGVYSGTITNYTFDNVTENHTVAVTFHSVEYTLSFAVYLEGEVVLTDTSSVPCGEMAEVEIPLFDCYHIDSLRVNGEWIEPVDLYVIDAVQMDYEVEAYLYADRFYVTTSVQGNGAVAPSDTVWGACTDDVTVTFVPETGWHVEEIILDGESLGAPDDNSYTILSISENHTLEVIFALNQYVITASVDPINAGQISPYGTQYYNYGESVTYHISPFPNYRIIRVEVDGEDVGDADSYTFSFVDADHTIVAYFETTGIDEVEASPMGIRVVNGELQVESNGHGAIVSVEVFDLAGRCVARQGASGTSAQLPLSVANGVYVVRVITTEAIESRKVSVNKW